MWPKIATANQVEAQAISHAVKWSHRIVCVVGSIVALSYVWSVVLLVTDNFSNGRNGFFEVFGTPVIMGGILAYVVQPRFAGGRRMLTFAAEIGIDGRIRCRLATIRQTRSSLPVPCVVCIGQNGIAFLRYRHQLIEVIYGHDIRRMVSLKRHISGLFIQIDTFENGSRLLFVRSWPFPSNGNEADPV